LKKRPNGRACGLRPRAPGSSAKARVERGAKPAALIMLAHRSAGVNFLVLTLPVL
jgi:hypothetical protein